MCLLLSIWFGMKRTCVLGFAKNEVSQLTNTKPNKQFKHVHDKRTYSVQMKMSQTCNFSD